MVQARQVGPTHCSLAPDLHSPISALEAGVHRRRGQARRAGLALVVVELLVAGVVALLEEHLSELVSDLIARLSCL